MRSLGRKSRVSGHWPPVLGHLVPIPMPSAVGEVPDGSDRNTELMRRVQLLEAVDVHDLMGRIQGQQHTGQQSRAKKTIQPQTEEQRGKRACLPNGQKIDQHSLQQNVGSTGQQPERGAISSSARILGRRCKAARNATRDQGSSKTLPSECARTHR